MAVFGDGNCVKQALVLLIQRDMTPMVRPYDAHALDSLLTRVRGEYREMPGMKLTIAQAARLWQLDPSACEAVLKLLVHDGFLTQTAGGTFIAALHGE
jgi:hypothetical protein